MHPRLRIALENLNGRPIHRAAVSIFMPAAISAVLFLGLPAVVVMGALLPLLAMAQLQRGRFRPRHFHMSFDLLTWMLRSRNRAQQALYLLWRPGLVAVWFAVAAATYPSTITATIGFVVVIGLINAVAHRWEVLSAMGARELLTRFSTGEDLDEPGSA
jgi:hypothetical protein